MLAPAFLSPPADPVVPSSITAVGAPAKHRRAGWAGLVATILLLAYAAMAYTATSENGVSFDEAQQLAVGYNIWVNDDYRIEGANGDFIKRWATLPYLVSRPKFVGPDDANWRGAEPYEVGYRFFFELGNYPESLLRQGRAMVVILGMALGLLVFVRSQRLFGPVGGLISLVMFAFSPHMLAFGGIVSTDLSVTLLLLGSTVCIWGLLHEVTWRRVVVSVVVFGLLLLAKLSALAIFPLTAVLVAVKLRGGRPLVLRWRGRSRAIAERRGQLALVAALVLVHAVGGWTTIWAHYGFRYTASPHPADPGLVMRDEPRGDEVPRVFRAVIDWSRATHFFPEGFRRGVHLLLKSDDRLASFQAGKWTLGGQATFFPYAIWVKSTPAFLVVLAVALVGWLRSRRETNSPVAVHAAPTLYDLAPHLSLIGTYLGLALLEDINLGHRHVLPIYPSAYVLAGAVVLACHSGWARALVALSCVWLVRDSFAIRPHYLGYFGAQAGGPEQGYTRLVDSSLDWGMNLPGLKRWLDAHDPGGKEQVFLAYFGTDSPAYHGIKAHRLPGFFDWRRQSRNFPLEAGYYAVSASLLQGVYTSAFGPWTKESERVYQNVRRNFDLLNRARPHSPERRAVVAKLTTRQWEDEFYIFEHLRFARLCAWLRHQGQPPHHVGYSIFIWKLDTAALHAALFGPPVELVEGPLVMRRF